MSKNTPDFFDKLLKRVEVGDSQVGRSLARFLRYHPINEFEPFFESIGLKPSEYSSFLPQNFMFLIDDKLLLENYHVLCNYGVARNRIGKIYREARVVFGYDYGVLVSKLRSFEDLGLKQSLVAKIIASSPRLLIGNVDRDFVEVLEKLRKAGIDYDWLEEHINVDDTYDWKCMLELMRVLSKLVLSEGQLRQIFTLHPDILLECSGRVTFCLFGFLLKFGCTLSNVQTVFLEFPEIPVMKFANNLFRCYDFFVEINMDTQDIGKIMCSYPTVLGSCQPKKVKSLLSSLNCGQKQLCRMVKDDPPVLKKWVLGLKVNPLQKQKRVVKVKILKTEFLSSIGFVKDSEEMEKALKKFRGKVVELQQRFDCLVKFGLSREDVVDMIKATPQILNQSIDVIEAKVDFFVKELGYPVSDLVTYPKLLSYTIERVKLRLLMYKWLKGKMAVRANLTLSTLLSYSEEKFVKIYVNAHPRGHEYWKRLKKEFIMTDVE
ncbi:hypothetical protein PHJA_002688400 [Phtheirospermum japonicum]|uniref:Uncharacterized protein n=1 Tax=Phtheirospermum japonicum TaxID=374723 RepID=A0A830D478_9LAMI|nr:hypothetical protein PHJA_002688400 [Phtheirospermum japonicum]